MRLHGRKKTPRKICRRHLATRRPRLPGAAACPNAAAVAHNEHRARVLTDRVPCAPRIELTAAAWPASTAGDSPTGRPLAPPGLLHTQSHVRMPSSKSTLLSKEVS